jgi:hypothetical protein
MEVSLLDGWGDVKILGRLRDELKILVCAFVKIF